MCRYGQAIVQPSPYFPCTYIPTGVHEFGLWIAQGQCDEEGGHAAIHSVLGGAVERGVLVASCWCAWR
jgi:hypothetical protein